MLWVVATPYDWVKPIFLPSPGDVWDRLVELAKGGKLWDDIRISVTRIIVGFLLATVMAMPIGVLIGCYRFWEAAIEPLVDFIRYMPVVAFVPLTILWAGTGDIQKFLIIWIGTFFQQVLLVMDNVKRVPRTSSTWPDAGKGPGDPAAHRGAAAMPAIWDSMRISLGWAWTWLVLAELVAATSGLGYRITTAQRFFQTDTIIGYILCSGFSGSSRPGHEGARPPALPLRGGAAMTHPGRARDPAEGVSDRTPHGPALDGARCRWARTSSSRSSGLRAAARARCSRSSPGCWSPPTGEVLVDGQPVRGPGRDRGVVFQSYTLFPWLTCAAATSSSGCEAGASAPASDARRRSSTSSSWGSRASPTRCPNELSGGMKQRVAIARALSYRPRCC